MNVANNTVDKNVKNGKLEKDFEWFKLKVGVTLVDSIVSGTSVNPAEACPGKVALTPVEAAKYKALMDQLRANPQSYEIASAERWTKFFAGVYQHTKRVSCSPMVDKPKRNLLIRLKEMFDSPFDDVSILYLVGASNLKGNYLIESKQSGIEELTFKEILDEWDNRKSEQRYLLVIADFNYSGKWMEELRKDKQRWEGVAVLCSTQAAEKGSYSTLGTYFTHNMLKLCNKISSEAVIQVDSVPGFAGDILICKKNTNLYFRFATWAELMAVQKADFVIIDYETGQFAGHIEGGLKKYWGTFSWKSGSLKDCVYYGEFDKGKQEGLGIMKYNNGRVYEGQWRASVPDGKGTETYINGDKYTGEFSKGSKVGKGTYTYANGDEYKGLFTDNKPNGKGVLKMKKGAVYQGGFVNGKCHGKGEYIYENGDVYNGEWANSVKHGKGVYKYANGDEYHGGFVNGVRQGKGRMTLIDGKVMEGNWENDMMHGEGKYEGLDHTVVGEWVRGKQASKPQFYQKDGSKLLNVDI